ncbi:MAG TPA: hypothetical protein VEH50_07875 [Methylomirabilota bacterium]|nr:hypothetical protein [Methylomirabilota bacterium]
MQRPTGVTVIAIFQIAFAVFAILLGLMAFGFGSVVAMHRAAFGGAFGAVAGALGAVFGIFLLALGVLYIVVGVGMLKLANWARLVTLVFSALGALLHVLRLFHSMVHPHLFLFHAFWSVMVIAICVLIIWYLLQPNVKQAFGES